MSPWLRKELRVIVCPEQVKLFPVRRKLTLRGLRRTIDDWPTMCFQQISGADPWRAALSTLEAALPGAVEGRTEATVILSNQFVRYALVPWQAGLAGAQEDLAYSRHCFTRVYGKAAEQWEIRLSAQSAEGPRLASAVDAELLGGLRTVFDAARMKLRSIQPHLMAAVNGARAQLRRRSAWLALLEPGHLCLALLHDGQWVRVRNVRMEGAWRIELLPILEREACLAGDAATTHEVFLSELEPGDSALPESAVWQFHTLPSGFARHAQLFEAGRLAAVAG